MRFEMKPPEFFTSTQPVSKLTTSLLCKLHISQIPLLSKLALLWMIICHGLMTCRSSSRWNKKGGKCRLTCQYVPLLSAYAHLRHSNASPAYEANSRIAGQTHEKIILVLDRMDENHAVIETQNGTFFIPREILPHEMQKEGTVFELHHVPSQAEKRLVQAQARLERMQVVTL